MKKNLPGANYLLSHETHLSKLLREGCQSVDKPVSQERQLSRCLLAEWRLASVVGNDIRAMEHVTSSVQALLLSEQRLARLQMAVVEATRNAIEHGNQYCSDLVIPSRC